MLGSVDRTPGAHCQAHTLPWRAQNMTVAQRLVLQGSSGFFKGSCSLGELKNTAQLGAGRCLAAHPQHSLCPRMAP